MLVTSPDSNNTFTCNTVFSPHSTRKWYAKPFHKFLSNEQNVETITCSENASLSVYFDSCFDSMFCQKRNWQEWEMWKTWHTDHPWLSTFPCHCVFICLSFIWISQLNRVSLSEDLCNVFVNVCRIAVAICLWQPRRQQLFTTVWNTELVCDK